MKPEESKVMRMVIARRMGFMGMNPEPTGKSNAWVWYIAIILAFSFYAIMSVEFFLLIVLLISLIYIPFVFAIRNAPRPRVEEEERVVVDEDIAHFKEMVKKALEGKAVAQRDIELRVLNTLAIDLSIRYDLPELLVRKNLANEDFLREYLGDKAKIVAEMFRRIHDLRTSLPRDEFLRNVNTILEAMK